MSDGSYPGRLHTCRNTCPALECCYLFPHRTQAPRRYERVASRSFITSQFSAHVRRVNELFNWLAAAPVNDGLPSDVPVQGVLRLSLVTSW